MTENKRGGAGRGQGRHPVKIKKQRKKYAYAETETPKTSDELAAWDWWKSKKPHERLGLILKIFLINANLKL